MIRIGGVVVVTVAAFLVCCTADPHQEQDVAGEHAGDRYDVNEHKTRNLDSVGGNLVREVREAHQAGPTNYLQRHLDYNSPYRARWPSELAGYYAEKRNFDEIDRSPLNTFVRKRNFDEIDQTAMPFPYAIKRFYHFYSPNYPPVSRLDQKRYRPDFPMDEIDLSGFPIGSKRSSDSYPLAARLR